MSGKIEGSSYIAFAAALAAVIRENPNAVNKSIADDNQLGERDRYLATMSSLGQQAITAFLPATTFADLVLSINKMHAKPLAIYEAAKRAQINEVAHHFLKIWSDKINVTLKSKFLAPLEPQKFESAFKKLCKKEVGFIRDKEAFRSDFIKADETRIWHNQTDTPVMVLSRQEFIFRILSVSKTAIPDHAMDVILSAVNRRIIPIEKYLEQKYSQLVTRLDLTTSIYVKTADRQGAVSHYLERMKNLTHIDLSGCIALPSNAFEGTRHNLLEEINISNTAINPQYITKENFPRAQVIKTESVVVFDFYKIDERPWEEIRSLAEVANRCVSDLARYNIPKKMSENPSLIGLEVMKLIRNRFKEDPSTVVSDTQHETHARFLYLAAKSSLQNSRLVIPHIFELLSDPNETVEFKKSITNYMVPFFSFTKSNYSKRPEEYFHELKNFCPSIDDKTCMTIVREALVTLRNHKINPAIITQIISNLKTRIIELDDLFYEGAYYLKERHLGNIINLIDLLIELSYQDETMTYDNILLDWRSNPSKKPAEKYKQIIPTKVYTLFALNLSSQVRQAHLRLVVENLGRYNGRLLPIILSGTLKHADFNRHDLFLNDYLSAYPGILYEVAHSERDKLNLIELKKRYLLELNRSTDLGLTKTIIDSLGKFCHETEDLEMKAMVIEVLGAMAHESLERPLTQVEYNNNLAPELRLHANQLFQSLRISAMV